MIYCVEPIFPEIVDWPIGDEFVTVTDAVVFFLHYTFWATNFVSQRSAYLYSYKGWMMPDYFWFFCAIALYSEISSDFSAFQYWYKSSLASPFTCSSPILVSWKDYDYYLPLTCQWTFFTQLKVFYDMNFSTKEFDVKL